MSRSGRRVVVAEVPRDRLSVEHFRVEDIAVGAPGPGEVLCRVVLLSIDPANRAWLQGRTYREQVRVGDTMAGFALGEVVAQNGTELPVGTIVSGDLGWQEYALLPARAVRRVEVVGPLASHLGLFGITGLTAYFGLLEVGRPRPGQTVLVSAAAGATGSVVGQLARIQAARAVGITGSARKNRILEHELGFDAVVDYRSDTFAEDLAAACPTGVDVYFDNVGGPVLEGALRHANVGGRIVCCGVVSQYDTANPAPGPRGVPGLLITKRLRMEGFLVLDYADRYAEAIAQLAEWQRAGRLVELTDMVDGLENAPAALVGLLGGENIGKRMVRVGPDLISPPI